MALAKYSSVDIIYNPKSTGSSQAAAKKLAKKLMRLYKDLPLILHATEYAGHAEQLAYECSMASKQPLIISASGDGGYNEVVNGVRRALTEGAKPVCAVLPAGNANDHSRVLQDKPLLQLIKRGRSKTIDLLKVTFVHTGKKTVRYAHSYVGLGLTPAVAAELNKAELNTAKELWLAAKTFFGFQPLRVKIGRKDMTVDSILFANISEMAKRLTMAKNAAPDDGKFEVIFFPHTSKRTLLWRIFRASIARLEDASQASSFTLTIYGNARLQFDGELWVADADSKVMIQSEHRILTTLI